MNIYYNLKGKFQTLKEIILFIPVLFEAKRWDYSSIFIILEHWLKRMEQVHREDSLHLDSPRYAKQIHTCVLLLKRINEDEYGIWEEYDKKWGKLTTWFTPTEDPNLSSFNCKRENAKTEEDRALSRKEFIACMEHEDLLKKQDIKYLFHLINKHHRSWWC